MAIVNIRVLHTFLVLTNIFLTSYSEELVLEDNFDFFNLSLWKHEITLAGGGNWEFQFYTNNRSNSYTRDGILYIKPTLMEDDIGIDNVMRGFTLNIWGDSPANLCTQPSFYGCERMSGAGDNYLNPIKSARIRTAESFSFKYGRVEVSAKLPKGDWLWPAIWMLPRDNQYGTWPASGEIDIMESRGNAPSYPAGGYDTFGSTLHFGPNGQNNVFLPTHSTKKDSTLASEFHVYGFIWNETYMGTYLDHESNTVLSHTINESFWELTGLSSPPWHNPWNGSNINAPFDQNFYLIINLACGGVSGYFPDGQGGKPWTTTDPHAVNSFYDTKDQWYSTWNGEESALQIDSVKVWTYEDMLTAEDRSDDSAANTMTPFYVLILIVSVISMMI